MFNINNRRIDLTEPPYIIAELSANHNGSINRAMKSILAAKQCGADAVKIQSYTADTMTINCDKKDFIVEDGLWRGKKIYDLYEEASTPFEWHDELFSYAAQIGMTIFSTPFDESSVDLLERLNTPAYKIASFEITDLALIRCVAHTKKPILISTGMASYDEICEAVETAKTYGCDGVLLFHCISSYPTAIENANLNQIKKLQKTFNIPIGLSDHTLGNIAAISAISIGACAIEKHFTLSRADNGPDSSFSIEPNELNALVKDSKDAWLSLGKEGFERPQSENVSKVFRRSIYFVANIKAGEKITKENIRRIRPGYGMEPKYFDSLIGKTVSCDVTAGDRVSPDFIKD
jgi:pseudaminic acid synthase